MNFLSINRYHHLRTFVPSIFSIVVQALNFLKRGIGIMPLRLAVSSYLSRLRLNVVVLPWLTLIYLGRLIF